MKTRSISRRNNLLFLGLALLTLRQVPVEGSAFFPRPSQHHVSVQEDGTTSTSTSSSVSGTAQQLALNMPRGGAWYFGKKTAARKYRELLEDQVTMLDRQLRQSKEELALLRRQLKTSQHLLHKSGSPGMRMKSVANSSEKLQALTENQELKKRVASLSKEIGQLEKMRDELQAIIEVQHMKIQELENKLKDKELDNQNLADRYEREMQKLKSDIDAKYQKQITELTKMMEKRIEEATEHARQVALRDMESSIEQATAAERQRGEKLLEEEKKRSEAAVEREKVKMRKLAKALFEREKKLNTLDKDISSAMESSSNTGKYSIGKNNLNASYKVDTIRKF